MFISEDVVLIQFAWIPHLDENNRIIEAKKSRQKIKTVIVKANGEIVPQN